MKQEQIAGRIKAMGSELRGKARQAFVDAVGAFERSRWHPVAWLDTCADVLVVTHEDVFLREGHTLADVRRALRAYARVWPEGWHD